MYRPSLVSWLHQRMRLTTSIVLIILMLGLAKQSPLSAQEPLAQPGPPAATLQDTPILFLQGATNISLVKSKAKLYYQYQPGCTPVTNSSSAAPMAATPRPTAIAEPAAVVPEYIGRYPTYGGRVRDLFRHTIEELCPNQIRDVRSNIVADEDFVYWASPDGIRRLAEQANPTDTPELFSVASAGASLLASDARYIYAATTVSGTSTIIRIAKEDRSITPLAIVGNGGVSQIGADGEHFYYLTVNGSELHRIVMDTLADSSISSDVRSFYPEGTRTFISCTNGSCSFLTTQYVYIGIGNQVRRYNSINNGSLGGLVYTSTDPSAVISSMTSDDTSLFISERQSVACSPSPCSATKRYALVRGGRSAGITPTPLYTTAASVAQPMPIGMSTDGTFLFWAEGTNILRLPNNAAALPVVNLRVTGIELTQGIQDTSNSVPLIRDKRTFARVYAQSDGAAVSGVTAYLTGSWDNGANGWTLAAPTNPFGSKITLQPTPQRDNLNDSFLFELPWEWTRHGDLHLSASLNPSHFPLEPSYSDNTQQTTVTFRASPRLAVQFVSFGYNLKGTSYYPRLLQDIAQTYSWIRRVYPLASTSGAFANPNSGFRSNLWQVFDHGLGSRVNQTAQECSNNLCASAYTNNMLTMMRLEEGLPTNVFLYGMVSDAGGIFPRGQAGSGNVASGPAGSGFWGWDIDGSYADWYAGHELGHSLGRMHPAPGAAICGHSASDTDYPYANALISSGDNRFMGFDVGDDAFNIPMAVLPGTSWSDMLSYCNNQWISDYTYKGILAALDAQPASISSAMPQVTGDHGSFSIIGVINTKKNQAVIQSAHRLENVASVPPIVPGPYSLQLWGTSRLGVENALLADYPFTPTQLDEAEPAPSDQASTASFPTFSFAQVISATAGADTIRLVRIADHAVLAELKISPNAPVITSFGLPANSTDPLTGTINLHWASQDADGDAIQYDIWYSSNNGASFQPLFLHLPPGTSSQLIDTSQLPGTNAGAQFRLVASDGVNTSHAETPSVSLAVKAPQVRIVTPANGQRFVYDQDINLQGTVEGMQESLAENTITWTANGVPLPNPGTLQTLTAMNPGTYALKLQASNAGGISASDTVTITIDDDLTIPGPFLAVGPTSVGWHVLNDSTSVQTATIGINNAGSGNLRWKASTPADWLTLSAMSGDAPALLQLSANPGIIHEDLQRETYVDILSFDETQRVRVPVTLVAGNQQEAFRKALEYWLSYIPLFRR